MKKFIIALVVILIAASSLIYINNQTEDGLIEKLRIIFTPDPMKYNTYDLGQCTHYVFDKVKEDGNMIERRWGDAEHWAVRAKDDNYVVDSIPKEGSILQTDRGEIGHIAYIETIHDNGSVTVSEMNYYEPYEVTERTIEKEKIEAYQYIHPKINKHAGT